MIERLPPPPSKPVQERSFAQKLAEVTRLALMRICELLEQPISPDMKLAERRLIVNTATSMIKLVAQVQPAALGQAEVEDLVEYRAALAKFEANRKREHLASRPGK